MRASRDAMGDAYKSDFEQGGVIQVSHFPARISSKRACRAVAASSAIAVAAKAGAKCPPFAFGAGRFRVVLSFTSPFAPRGFRATFPGLDESGALRGGGKDDKQSDAGHGIGIGNGSIIWQ